MNVKMLKSILEKIPDDYEIRYQIDDLECEVHDTITIDLEEKVLILK